MKVTGIRQYPPGRPRPTGEIAALALVLAAALSGCTSTNPDFNPKHDGRALRIASSFPLTPFIYAWMGYHILTENRGPHEVSFEHARLYRPGLFVTPESGAELNADDRALLARHAPAIVQEVNPEAVYESDEIDRVGRPRPFETLNGEKYVHVDTGAPSLYTFLSRGEIHGNSRRQLNYVYWFPEHPPVKGGFDPEAGHVEGITLRITIDSDEQPLLYETVLNCGCYHRVYPSERVENLAAAEFGLPMSGRFTSVALHIPRHIDLYAPEFVRDDPDARLVIFSSSGSHQPLHIGRLSDVPTLASIESEHEVELREYAELEQGGTDGLGIFNPDKMVTGADRAETWMLYPTGLYHAGTPRRRRAQLIHFDQYDFDDPRLLEENLRLPAGI